MEERGHDHDSQSPFHSLGRLFPDETPPPMIVSPDTSVRTALGSMLEKRYSQLPVIAADGTVRGVFSLWSIVRYLARGHGPDVADLAVEDVMENLPQVTVNTSLYEVLENLEKHEAVLVMSPTGLQAVATSWDVLRYLFEIARPYVLLQEIELALRTIIAMAAPGEEIQECLEKSVVKLYERRGDPPPTSVHDLTFDDYKTLITAKENWPRFEPVIRSSRPFVGATLERIRGIRNRVFHFRTDLTVIDYEDLAAGRRWLLDRVQTIAPELDRRYP